MVLSSDGLVNRTVAAREVMQMTLQNSPDANRGRWYATVGSAVQSRLCEAYVNEPYPTNQQMEKLTREVRAPSVECIKTFYKCMQIKAQELCGH